MLSGTHPRLIPSTQKTNQPLLQATDIDRQEGYVDAILNEVDRMRKSRNQFLQWPMMLCNTVKALQLPEGVKHSSFRKPYCAEATHDSRCGIVFVLIPLLTFAFAFRCSRL